MFISSANEGIFEDMRAVWDALPRSGAEPLPRKKDFQPSLLKAHLSNIGIAEHLGDGRLSFRLQGTNSREFWGKEMTGTNYEAVAGHVPEGVTLPAAVLEAVFSQPCGLKSRREALSKYGDRWFCDMLALPFADANGVAKYLFYGYRIYPCSSDARGWEPGFADLSTAKLVSAGFVDVGAGIPG